MHLLGKTETFLDFFKYFFCLYLFNKYPLKLSNFVSHLLLLFIFCVLSKKERWYRQYIIGQRLTSSQIIAIIIGHWKTHIGRAQVTISKLYYNILQLFSFEDLPLGFQCAQNFRTSRWEKQWLMRDPEIHPKKSRDLVIILHRLSAAYVCLHLY